MERCSGASRAAERAKQCLGLVREAQASTGTRDWRYVDDAHESGLCSAQGSDRYGATRRLLREEPSRRPIGDWYAAARAKNDAQDALAITDRRPWACFWRDTPADRASLSVSRWLPAPVGVATGATRQKVCRDAAGVNRWKGWPPEAEGLDSLSVREGPGGLRYRAPSRRRPRLACPPDVDFAGALPPKRWPRRKSS